MVTFLCVFGILASFVTWAEDPREKTRNKINSYLPISGTQAPDALALCQAHPQLAAFQSEAAKQGRMLTNGEFYAMQEWVADSDEKQREAKELDALEALKMPTA